jgi:hypothetical protein
MSKKAEQKRKGTKTKNTKKKEEEEEEKKKKNLHCSDAAIKLKSYNKRNCRNTEYNRDAVCSMGVKHHRLVHSPRTDMVALLTVFSGSGWLPLSRSSCTTWVCWFSVAVCSGQLPSSSRASGSAS